MNWWKQASWYKKDPIIADPNEVGYHPSWGEHHGPVSYVPDTWNYGSKGYDSGSRPMPLPKKLYHVTPNSKEVLDQGFKTFENMNEQTFGGHGTYVSLTTLPNAKMYQEGLRDLWDAAYGHITAADIPDLGRKWGLKPEAVQRLWQETLQENEINRRGREVSEPELIAAFMQKMSHVSRDSLRFPDSKTRFPLFFGTIKNLMQKLKDKDQTNMGIIEAQPPPLHWHNGVNVGYSDRSKEEMADKYTFNGNEEEWRVWNPQHLDRTKLRRLEPREYIR